MINLPFNDYFIKLNFLSSYSIFQDFIFIKVILRIHFFLSIIIKFSLRKKLILTKSLTKRYIKLIVINILIDSKMISKQFITLNKTLFSFGFASQKIKVKNPVAELDGD